MKELELEYSSGRECRTVNPEAIGLHGVAQLGVSRLQRVRMPTEEHIHREMIEIGFCLRSAQTLEVGGRVCPVKPGHFFVNQPNVPHRLSTRPSGLYIYYFLLRTQPVANATLLDLPAAEADALCARLRALPSTVPAGGRAARVRSLFTRLFLLFDLPAAPWRAIRIRQTFLSLVVLLLEQGEQAAEASPSAQIAQIVADIRAHPERPLTIDALARQAALSPTHFINQFRKATGYPPIHFQIECRVQRAKALLLQRTRPVSDIALQLGFNSLQHFSDTFARLTGASPSQWRLERGKA